jgi:hypothetical protein
MKRLLTFIIAAIIFFPCGAQSWEEIKSSRQYIYGEGWGSSDAEADKNALADLISKISVQVQSSFTLTEDELSHNGQVDGETYARSKVQTYSQATLTNTEKIVIEYEPDTCGTLHPEIGNFTHLRGAPTTHRRDARTCGDC